MVNVLNKQEEEIFKQLIEERLPVLLYERARLDIEIDHLTNFLKKDIYKDIGNQVFDKYDRSQIEAIIKNNNN